jgi:hypothetical protein
MHGNSGMKNWGRVHGCSTLPRVATDGCIAARAMNTVMRTMGLLDGAISSIWLGLRGTWTEERDISVYRATSCRMHDLPQVVWIQQTKQPLNLVCLAQVNLIRADNPSTVQKRTCNKTVCV